jgi:hypothetical protein
VLIESSETFASNDQMKVIGGKTESGGGRFEKMDRDQKKKIEGIM